MSVNEVLGTVRNYGGKQYVSPPSTDEEWLQFHGEEAFEEASKHEKPEEDQIRTLIQRRLSKINTIRPAPGRNLHQNWG